MKAMILDSFGSDLVFREVPTPEPGPGEVLIKVRACGLCGSDLKIVGGKIKTTPLPIIPGHEIAGDVVRCGDGAPAELLGKRVVPHNYQSCLACPACREGAYNRCRDLRGRLGFELHGGLGEYVVVNAANAVPIPDGLDYVDAAVAPCALLAIYHAIKRADPQPDGRVAMLGVGGLGLHGIQFLAQMGVSAVAVDVAPAKLAMALMMGATGSMLFEEFAQGDDTYAVILDNVGKPDATRACLQKLDKGGRYVMVAYAPGVASVFDSEYMHLNETEILGTRNGTIHELADILELQGQGKVKAVVDRVLPLREANAALDLIRSGELTGRVIVSHDE